MNLVALMNFNLINLIILQMYYFILYKIILNSMISGFHFFAYLEWKIH